MIENPRVTGSIPVPATSIYKDLVFILTESFFLGERSNSIRYFVRDNQSDLQFLLNFPFKITTSVLQV